MADGAAHRRYWLATSDEHPPVLGVTEQDGDGSWCARRVAVEGVCGPAEVQCETEGEAFATVRDLAGLGEFGPSPFVAVQGIRKRRPPRPNRWSRRRNP